MLEVINLTNPEEAKNLTKRFFEDELKMDLADPRFNSRKRRESSVSVCYGIEDEVLYVHWQEIRRFSNWMQTPTTTN